MCFIHLHHLSPGLNDNDIDASSNSRVAWHHPHHRTRAQALKAGVSDIVSAVPGWYTDVQRSAIQDVAALNWGITKIDLPVPENLRPWSHSLRRRRPLFHVRHHRRHVISAAYEGLLAPLLTSPRRILSLYQPNRRRRAYRWRNADPCGPRTHTGSARRKTSTVVRGVTFACALVNPTFRVHEFHIRDITPYSIKVSWDRSETESDDTELVVFPYGNATPSTKVLTLYRKGPFDTEASYAEPQGLPGHINPWVARFSAKSVLAEPTGDLTCAKPKTRLNPHYIMYFEAVHVEEMKERVDQGAMDAGGSARPGEQPKMKRAVKVVHPLCVVAGH